MTELALERSNCLVLAMALLLGIPGIGCGVVRVVPPQDPHVMLSEPTNLGFEQSLPRGGARGWERGESPDADYEARGYVLGLDEKVKRSGRYSAAITFKQSFPGGTGPWGAWGQNYDWPAVAGKVIHVRAWIRTVGAETCAKCEQPGHDEDSLPEGERRGAEIRILANGGYETLTPFVTGTSNWTRFEARAKVDPYIDDDIIVAPILWGKGRVWFDDLEIRVE